jgi:hypothetical protein
MLGTGRADQGGGRAAPRVAVLLLSSLILLGGGLRTQQRRQPLLPICSLASGEGTTCDGRARRSVCRSVLRNTAVRRRERPAVCAAHPHTGHCTAPACHCLWALAPRPPAICTLVERLRWSMHDGSTEEPEPTTRRATATPLTPPTRRSSLPTQVDSFKMNFDGNVVPGDSSPADVSSAARAVPRAAVAHRYVRPRLRVATAVAPLRGRGLPLRATPRIPLLPPLSARWHCRRHCRRHSRTLPFPQLGMEDGDQLESLLAQTGGGGSRR